MVFPEIEGHVDIGAGAKILGPVRIGAHAKVGANAVVISNIKSGDRATGIPAKSKAESKTGRLLQYGGLLAGFGTY